MLLLVLVDLLRVALTLVIQFLVLSLNFRFTVIGSTAAASTDIISMQDSLISSR